MKIRTKQTQKRGGSSEGPLNGVPLKIFKMKKVTWA